MAPRNGPEEPSADMRQLAATLREMYVALIYEGFAEREAVLIIGQVLAANRADPPPSAGGDPPSPDVDGVRSGARPHVRT